MPELPEVETVCRGLQPAMEGQSFKTIEQRRANLRFPFPDNFINRLRGQTVTSLSRRAKYLLADLSNGDVLVMHLGMSGSFLVNEAGTHIAKHKQSKLPAHDHVVFRMSNGAKVTYNDPRRFGFMLLIPRENLTEHDLFAKMGIEPLGNELTSGYLAAKFANKSTTLKATLLDQRIVVGLGNIYVAEILWRSSLSPKKRASSLVLKSGKPSKKLDLLIQNIRDVLQEAIKAGGSTLQDHAQTDGTLGYFQHGFAVYDREGDYCKKDKCKGLINRFTQNGRSTFWCPTCQR